MTLRVCGTKSYKPWVTALAIDLARWLVQSQMGVRDSLEVAELSQRKRDMVSKAVFRPPFFGRVFKPRVVEPILNRLMSSDRWLYRIIMYILEMRSSITLTV